MYGSRERERERKRERERYLQACTIYILISYLVLYRHCRKLPDFNFVTRAFPCLASLPYIPESAFSPFVPPNPKP